MSKKKTAAQKAAAAKAAAEKKAAKAAEKKLQVANEVSDDRQAWERGESVECAEDESE